MTVPQPEQPQTAGAVEADAAPAAAPVSKQPKRRSAVPRALRAALPIEDETPQPEPVERRRYPTIGALLDARYTPPTEPPSDWETALDALIDQIRAEGSDARASTRIQYADFLDEDRAHADRAHAAVHPGPDDRDRCHLEEEYCWYTYAYRNWTPDPERTPELTRG